MLIQVALYVGTGVEIGQQTGRSTCKHLSHPAWGAGVEIDQVDLPALRLPQSRPHGVRELKTSNRNDFEIRQLFDKRGDDKRKGCAVLLPTLHPVWGAGVEISIWRSESSTAAVAPCIGAGIEIGPR